MTETLQLSEGAVFAVGYDKERWVRGLLARVAGRTALGYFVGPPLAAAPGLEDFAGMTRDDAVYICRVSDAGFRTGQWKVLGTQPGFDRAQWPIPELADIVEIGTTAWLYEYGDDIGADPTERRVKIEDARAHPPVGLHMAGAVERQLWQRLKDS